MQPYLFPYLGYFQLINAVDTFVIYDDVQYIKRGWINRNRILVGGEDHLFSFSVEHDAQEKMIHERRYDESFTRESHQFLKTLKHEYAKAEQFQSVMSLVSDILGQDERNVARMNALSIQRICDYLGITTSLLQSSGMNKDCSLTGAERILHINALLEGRRYINPIGGEHLYSRDAFAKHGIDLQFLKSHEVRYQQQGECFVPSLSIIDVLMFNHPQQVLGLLSEYDLV